MRYFHPFTAGDCQQGCQRGEKQEKDREVEGSNRVLPVQAARIINVIAKEGESIRARSFKVSLNEPRHEIDPSEGSVIHQLSKLFKAQWMVVTWTLGLVFKEQG